VLTTSPQQLAEGAGLELDEAVAEAHAALVGRAATSAA
jgi:hypothetical protein